MTFLLALVLAFPDSFTAKQGRALDGGMTAWAVECTNCTGGGGTTNVAGGGTIDGGSVGVSFLPVVFIGDAGTLNVNFPATQAVTAATLPLPSGASTAARQDTGNTSLANLDVALSTRTKPADQQHTIIDSSATVPVSLATAPTTPITAVTLPLPAFASTDAMLSQLLDGGVGLLSTIAANQTNGNQQVQVMLNRYPLNPFLPRCNPVRRTGCQP